MSKQSPPSQEQKSNIINSFTAKEQALSWMTQLEKAFKEGLYGALDKPFEQKLTALLALLKSCLGGLTAQQRMDNPTHLVMRLLTLMSHDVLRNIAQEELRYSLAAVLHLALDLVVLESYEDKWVSLPKTIRTPHGEIEILSIINEFRRGEPTWGRQYELDCCQENIRALLEKKKSWEKALSIIKSAIQKDVGGLLNCIHASWEEMQPLWQLHVLLLRRLTPLAQRSAKALAVLQTVIAEHYQVTEFHCHYAAQEALHNIILGSEGAERLMIQQQALGQFVTEKEIKAVRQRPTFWYLTQTPPSERRWLEGQVSGQADNCRYYLIQAVGDLLLKEIESKSNNSSEKLLNEIIEILIYLKDNEPAYLKKSKAWITTLIETVKKDKPKAYYIQQFHQENPDIEHKHVKKDQQRIQAELKLLIMEREEQKEQLHKAVEEKVRLEKTLEQFLKEQMEWEQKKVVLLEEKAALTQNLDTAKSDLSLIQLKESRHKRELDLLQKQIKSSEDFQKELVGKLSELEQNKSAIIQSKIQALANELKQEKEHVEKLRQSQQDFENKSLSLKSQEAELIKNQKELSVYQEQLDEREKQISNREQTFTERQALLEEQVEALKQLEIKLNYRQAGLNEQEIALRQRQEEIREHELAMQMQEEEFKLAAQKLNVPLSPPSPSSISIIRWEVDPKLAEKYEEMASEPSYIEKIEKEGDFELICPVLHRLNYDAINVWVKDDIHGAHVVSEKSAREWFNDRSQTTCPHCQTKAIERIEKNTNLRNMVQRRLDKFLAAAKQNLPQQPRLEEPVLIESKPEAEIDSKALEQLLRYVVEGEQDQAEKLIQKNPKLLLQAGRVSDLSDRTFENITAFQYALWAMDWHMWTMIQKYLPPENQREQLTVLEDKGTEHGKHFDFKPILQAFQKHVENYGIWSNEESENNWIKVIGKEQKQLPVHVVNEYCREDRSFEPCPSFTEEKLIRTRKIKPFGNEQEGEWFTTKGLGDSITHYRSSKTHGGKYCTSVGIPGAGLAADFNAIKYLVEVRTRQLESLKSGHIQKPIMPLFRPPRTPLAKNFLTLLPPPKSDSKESAIQDQLILACENGDLNAVKNAIEKGAKAHIHSSKDKHPLATAVWGMNPEVVNYLLTQFAQETPIMTWKECEAHNQKHYRRVFIISAYNYIETNGDLDNFLDRLEKSSFMKNFCLNQIKPEGRKLNSWEELRRYHSPASHDVRRNWKRRVAYYAYNIRDYKSLQAQIETSIVQAELAWREEAKQPHKPAEAASALPAPSSAAQNPSSFLPPPKPGAKPADAKEVAKLLRLVAEGEQDQAEAMIKQKPELLLTPGKVTDLSERTFESVTAFQYALWALDWHMWKMIQKYIPPEAAAEQLSALETKGLGNHGKHFSLQPLISALQTYVDNAEKVWNYDQRATDHWCKVVGGAQRQLPAHVVNEYSRPDRPFDPCPTFTEAKLPRTREMEVWDGSNYVKGSWFISPTGKNFLGSNFAFCRGRGVGGSRLGFCGVLRNAAATAGADLLALQSLLKTRTQQLELLRTELLAAKSSQSQSPGR